MNEAFIVIRDHHDYYASFDNLAVFPTREDALEWCRRLRTAAGEPLWDDPDDYDQHYKVRSIPFCPTEIVDRQGRFPDDKYFKPWETA